MHKCIGRLRSTVVSAHIEQVATQYRRVTDELFRRHSIVSLTIGSERLVSRPRGAQAFARCDGVILLWNSR
jgi:hypothetical protein